MITKIVYVLVSNPTDYYYEQMLISITTACLHTKDVFIEVVTDTATSKTFSGTRDKISTFASKITIVETPEGLSPMQISRYLKTNLRNLIDGDYLFIDTDTIVCKPLDDIDKLTCSIGAVYDNHIPWPIRKDSDTPSENWAREMASKVNPKIDIIGSYHFNSGIFFVRDTIENHEFYKRWSDNYQRFSKNGVNFDQLSLCVTNREFENHISVIDPRWNCQLSLPLGDIYFQEAKIIHFNGLKSADVYKECLKDVKNNGFVDSSIMKKIEIIKASYTPNYVMVRRGDAKVLYSDIFKVFQSFPFFYKILSFQASLFYNIMIAMWKIKKSCISE